MIKHKFEIILYVADQKKSTDFYTSVFKKKPDLNVPGMTEYVLTNELKFGLMPENGIAKILANKAPHPSLGNGIPRCELYLYADNIEESFSSSIENGAREISKIQERDWGDTVGYVADFDGHIIAFAKRKTGSNL